MRKRTVKHFFIYLYRSVFLLLPLLAGLVFSAIKLPLNSPSWDYGEELTEEDDNSLSERFNVFFASALYEPMKQLGLQSTFVYDGTSRLFNLLGFSVPTGSLDYTWVSVEDDVSAIAFRFKDLSFGERFDNDLTFFESLNLTPTWSPLAKVDFITPPNNYFSFPVISARKNNSTYELRFSTIVPRFQSSDVYFTTSASTVYSVTTSGVGGCLVPLYQYSSLLDDVSYSLNSVVSMPFLECADTRSATPAGTSSIYIEFFAMYISYVIFLFIFEVFIRVMIWIPKFIIHYLDKPFFAVGENDVD